MNAHTGFSGRVTRPFILALGVALWAAASTGIGFSATAAEPSVPPAAAASATPGAPSEPAATPATTMCQSASDLRFIVGFLRDNSVAEDGLLPELVGTVAALSEARTLLGLVDETYRPLVADLVAALQGLRATVDSLPMQETLGAGVASVGESITQIGLAMDALTLELRAPCPELDDPTAG